MSKDPAFLFYSKDFYTGVATMSFEDRGKYISILCLMHQQGRMEEETIRFLVGSVSVTLKSKFEVDENGLWYNERLEEEAEKRVKFTESRRLNGVKGGRPKPSGYASGKPTDNLVGDVDILSNKNVFKEKKEITTVKEKSTKVVGENFEVIEVIQYLNELNGTRFRTDTKSTNKLIEQRIRGGFPVEELKEIIEYKVGEWKGTEREKWLQPDTLFAEENCSKYRNQVQAAKDKKMTLAQIKGNTGGKIKPTMEGILDIIYNKQQ